MKRRGANSAADVRTVRLPLTSSGVTEMPVTASSESHVAGFPILVGGTVRQCCAWCGRRLAATNAKQDGLPAVDFPAANHANTWQVGGFVRADVDGRAFVGILWQDPIPSDACCFGSAGST